MKIKFFRSSNGQDSSSAEIEEDIMSNKKDSNDVLESLRQVQEHVTTLNASIGGMKEEWKNYLKPPSK